MATTVERSQLLDEMLMLLYAVTNCDSSLVQYQAERIGPLIHFSSPRLHRWAKEHVYYCRQMAA